MDESVEALIETQEDLEAGEIGILPWFLRQIKQYSFAEVEDGVLTPSFDLPEGFIREVEGPAMYIRGHPALKTNYFPLRMAENGRVPTYIFDTIAYYFDTERIYFDRIAADDRSIPTVADFIYYKADQILTTDIENAWLKYASQLMIGLAGRKLSGVRDTQARNRFEDMRQSGARAIRRQNASHIFSGKKPVFGLNEEVQFNRVARYNDYDDGQ